MPSSPDVVAWQPPPIDAPAPVGIPLPQFQVDDTPTPTLHAFSVSPSAGIPADLLAAQTAAARAAGYADGWAAGLADARAATRARQDAEATAAADAAAERKALQHSAFEAVFQAAEALERQSAPSATDIEEQILAAAWAIAAALVGQVVADGAARSEAAVRRALSLAPADEDVTITVSAADFAVLTGESAGGPPMTVIRRERGLRTVTIAPDPRLAPGDAVARCGATTIDARLGAALDRVKGVLAP